MSYENTILKRRALIQKASYVRPWHILGGDEKLQRIHVIEQKLNKLRKGRGFRSMRRFLRRERDRLWAEHTAERLAES